jgi:hypothetical protein
MWWFIGLGVFFFFIVPMIFGACGAHSRNDDPNAEHNVGWHRFNGQFRVLYLDGNFSQPFTYAVACDYAKIFGGRVVPKEAYEQAGRPVYP